MQSQGLRPKALFAPPTKPRNASGQVAKAKRRLLSRCQKSAQKEQPVGARLVRDYCRLQRPASHNIIFSKALEEFTSTAVLAFECGYTESLVREELSGAALPLLPPDSEQDAIENCVISLALVWITLSMLPSSAKKRWATGQAVSQPMIERWEGFVRMIVRGYFEKRWAAYPIDRLQMEISLVTGRQERPSVVAEWSRLVYAALEHAAPQWPSK